MKTTVSEEERKTNIEQDTRIPVFDVEIGYYNLLLAIYPNGSAHGFGENATTTLSLAIDFFFSLTPCLDAECLVVVV